MDATITPMDPQKHGTKSGLEWSYQNQTINARINAAGGQGGELVEHEGERADGMRDQSHRQRDDDEQCDEAGGDDGDAQVYREHVESEHDRPSFPLLFRFFGQIGVVDGDALRLKQHGCLAHGGGAALHGFLGPDPVGQPLGQVGDAGEREHGPLISLCRSTMATTARLCSAR
mgnify:CR=1 FL=1